MPAGDSGSLFFTPAIQRFSAGFQRVRQIGHMCPIWTRVLKTPHVSLFSMPGPMGIRMGQKAISSQ